ncbi:hypothetical protein BaRGS_00012099 [Batillaria attramentaria]|uniref:Uncharacterized protein n=1 Tax=Batillaria attramentaria TaxID=370345 RepID=A0ABD0LCI5_9CAEN
MADGAGNTSPLGNCRRHTCTITVAEASAWCLVVLGTPVAKYPLETYPLHTNYLYPLNNQSFRCMLVLGTPLANYPAEQATRRTPHIPAQ